MFRIETYVNITRYGEVEQPVLVADLQSRRHGGLWWAEPSKQFFKPLQFEIWNTIN